MNQKYICVHGHFYQPPRQNAWLEEIELQESAWPFHDWNERITDECYGPNGFSRILNEDMRIIDISNNYSKISFNFGPTLLSWLEKKRPKVYQRIIEADRESTKQFGGHGSAMAQVYNHIIMPLANRRDKETQVIWGIRDFEHRFNRKPEGMWLAETAVDTETLEVLAENGISFTILAPRQAKAYRKIGAKDWKQGIDTRVPYICQLPSGKSINLFFYDGERSQDVAFKGLLIDGKEFANRLLSGFDNNSGKPQLVHIGTDGESYGHHHRHGDMALAYCLRYIETNDLATLTNYGQFLELAKPTYEVQINENSSWSCEHGVERWRSNCGCNAGHAGWNQLWRKPLREALDWLRDELAVLFEEQVGKYHPQPWELRNEYIELMLNRSEDGIHNFLQKNIEQPLSDTETTKLIRLLDMQKHALYMYTSCAWFFDEISGIETVQVLQYANRAIQYAESESELLLHNHFKMLLAACPSNVPQFANGEAVYEKYVEPARLTLTTVGMHYAINTLFREDADRITVLNYHCTQEVFEKYTAGAQILAAGRTLVQSKVTLSHKHFSFVILYLGNHHIIGRAFDNMPIEEYEKLVGELRSAFEAGNLASVIDMLKDSYKEKNFTFYDLFKDEQIRILNEIMSKNLELAEVFAQQIYERTYNLLNVMQAANLQAPQMLEGNLLLVLENDLQNQFKRNGKPFNLVKLKETIAHLKKWEVKLDTQRYTYLSTKKLAGLVEQVHQSNYSFEVLDNVYQGLKLLREINIYPEMNELQDLVFRLITLPELFYPDEKQQKEILEIAYFIDIDVNSVFSSLYKTV